MLFITKRFVFPHPTSEECVPRFTHFNEVVRVITEEVVMFGFPPEQNRQEGEFLSWAAMQQALIAFDGKEWDGGYEWGGDELGGCELKISFPSHPLQHSNAHRKGSTISLLYYKHDGICDAVLGVPELNDSLEFVEKICKFGWALCDAELRPVKNYQIVRIRLPNMTCDWDCECAPEKVITVLKQRLAKKGKFLFEAVANTSSHQAVQS